MVQKARFRGIAILQLQATREERTCTLDIASARSHLDDHATVANTDCKIHDLEQISAYTL